MALLQLSSDVIQFSGLAGDVFLERQKIEEYLPEVLVHYFGQHTDDILYVVNGPGGFTHLRVGCLLVNLLLHYLDRQVCVYDISKLDLYGAAVKGNFLPSLGLIYIGQQKQAWLYDFHTMHYVSFTLGDQLPDRCFVDMMSPAFAQKHGLLHGINYAYVSTGLQLQWQGTQRHYDPVQAGLSCVQALRPRYMIEPTLG